MSFTETRIWSSGYDSVAAETSGELRERAWTRTTYHRGHPQPRRQHQKRILCLRNVRCAARRFAMHAPNIDATIIQLGVDLAHEGSSTGTWRQECGLRECSKKVLKEEILKAPPTVLVIPPVSSMKLSWNHPLPSTCKSAPVSERSCDDKRV
jgi:hypothetical protein